MDPVNIPILTKKYIADKCGCFLIEDFIYCPKWITKNNYSCWDNILYEAGKIYHMEFGSRQSCKDFNNTYGHGPGLWAFKQLSNFGKFSSPDKDEKVIVVKYHLSDIILLENAVKGSKMTVVDINPEILVIDEYNFKVISFNENGV